MKKLNKAPENGFKITKRHYDIILKQGRDLLPIEAGGFLAGDEQTGVIKGIYPIFNQHLEAQTNIFGFTHEDIQRAYRFCQKHDLCYFGMYHTHPKGIAYPSQADINVGHLFHFILSLKNPENPDFKAYIIQQKKAIQVPFVVIQDKGFSKKENNSAIPQYDASTQATLNDQQTNDELNHKLEQLKNKKKPYQRYQSHNPDSEFNTLA